jgi:hypothetical protein
MEEWKYIEGYEGKYAVSTAGRVASMNYCNSGKIKELKQKRNRYGYMEVCLSKGNKRSYYLVATLVAREFIPNPNNKPKVMHISRDKVDNRVENLKWAYNSEINFWMYKIGTRKIGKPSKNIISYKGKGYKSYREMAQDNGVDPQMFYKRIARGWSLEDALEMENGSWIKATKYEFYGRELTIKEIAKENNITEKLIRKRLSRYWNIYESAEIPVAIMKKGGK